MMTVKIILKRTLQTAVLSVLCLSLPQIAYAATLGAPQEPTATPPALGTTAASRPPVTATHHHHGHHHKGSAAPEKTVKKLDECQKLLAAAPKKGKRAANKRAHCEKYVKEHSGVVAASAAPNPAAADHQVPHDMVVPPAPPAAAPAALAPAAAPTSPTAH